MFTRIEIKIIRNLIANEIKRINSISSLSDENRVALKRTLNSLEKKITATQVPADISDMLSIDKSIMFDEVLLMNQGKPIARIANSQKK